MDTKRITRISSVIAILFLVVLGVLYKSGLLSANDKERKGDAKATKEASPKTNQILARGQKIKNTRLIDKIVVSGTVLPNEEVELSSESGGLITGINFREGMQVGQGSLLVKINDLELRAQVDRLNTQVKLYENREYRQRKLLEKGGVSQDEYDGVLAELNQLKAQVKEVQAKIRQTEVRAPFSGTIGLRKVSKGSYIGPGTAIARLVNLDQLKLEFSVPEKYMSRIKNGQKVQVISETIDKSYSGSVYAIEPKISLETRTITVRAIISNKDRLLMPGAFVNIEIILQEYDETIQVPTIAVISELGGQKVFKYENGAAQPVKVKTGLRTEQNVQITEGLNLGDTVITSGLVNVRPNASIKLIEVK